MNLEDDMFTPVVPTRMGFLEVCYGIMFQPKVTLKKIAEQEPLFYAFVILLSVSILNTVVSFSLIMPETLRNMESSVQSSVVPTMMLHSPAIYLGGIIFGLIGAMLGWFFKSAIFQLIAEIFGGEGRGLGVMSVIGCAALPMIFLIPLQVIRVMLHWPSWVIWVFALPISVWSNLVLPILGVAEVHRISTGKATMVVIMPFLALVGLLILVGILMGVMIAPFLSQFGTI